METLEKLIRMLPKETPSRELGRRILLSIAEARERSIRLHRKIFGGLSLLSGIAVIPALVFSIKELLASPFVSYLSLLITDRAIALANWKEFLLTLAESAPVFDLLLIFGAAFIFLASLKALAPYMRQRLSSALV